MNHANRGELWADYGIRSERVVAYDAHIADGSPDLRAAAGALVDDEVAPRWFPEQEFAEWGYSLSGADSGISNSCWRMSSTWMLSGSLK